ncbi:hypothetical protein ACFSJU_00825 [Paradesertivirga mongoliensis]|uniref:Outer membrane protein beta-barrel domain-containing protein n=1 Tax=Paradesertivirga mongoliensis TaxID=2100740 RepID=A0ABW4ZH36_9SPHI|nr:hypothetical protein [Pedobacter mongoliensis]
MKTFLLASLFAAISLYANSQTKGTNSVGFGVNLNNRDSEQPNSSDKQSSHQYLLNYGHFIKDNVKIGISGSYGRQKFESLNSYSLTSELYGGGLSYQKYYPLFKKLYAYAGANAGYQYSEEAYLNTPSAREIKTNIYTVGASGGVAIFLSKHLALEAHLLNASALYSKGKDVDNGAETTQQGFHLNSSGALNNFGFQIHFLF